MIFFIVIGFLFLVWLLVVLLGLWLASLMGFRMKRRQPGPFVIVLFAPFGLLALLCLVGWWKSPTKLSQADVIGKYEIDRNFFSGEEADWQHETYQMEITGDELILQDVRTETVWRYPVEWSWKGRWSFASDDLRHHLVRNGPTLYRGQFSHYYVFKSPLYGNVFLRPEPRIFSWIFWGGFAIFLSVAFWLCCRQRG